jgi:hypothetical protein
VNLFSDYNSIVKFKTHEDEIETRKGGALLLAIALSGEVAAQTKDASQDPYIATMSEGFKYLRNWQSQ